MWATERDLLLCPLFVWKQLKCSAHFADSKRGKATTTRKCHSGFQPTRLSDRLGYLIMQTILEAEFYSDACSSKQRFHGSGLGCPYKEWFVVTQHRKKLEIHSRWKVCGIFMREATVCSSGPPRTEVLELVSIQQPWDLLPIRWEIAKGNNVALLFVLKGNVVGEKWLKG